MSISSTISVISSLRLLLFKKVNIAYCNILYFSHYLNNLSSVSKYYKNNDYKRDNHLITNNKLINNNKINDKNQSIGNNDIAKYLKNKSYIYMTPIFIIGIISIIIMAGGKDKITKKLSSSGKRVPSNSNYKSEIELIDFNKIKKLKKPKKKGSVSVQSDSKKPVLENNLTAETELIADDARDPWSTISLSDWPSETLDGILSSIHLPGNPFHKTTSDELDHETMDTEMNYVNETTESSELFPELIVNKSYEDNRFFSPLPDNIPSVPSCISIEQRQTNSDQRADNFDVRNESSDQDKDTKIQDVGLNSSTCNSDITYMLVASHRKNKIFPANRLRTNCPRMNEWVKQTKDLKITSTSYFYTINSDDYPSDIVAYILNNDTGGRNILPITHTHTDYLTNPKSFIEDPKYFLLFSKEKKEEFIGEWFRTSPYRQEEFCRQLYLCRKREQSCGDEAFIFQVHSYFYQVKLSSKQQWIRPNSYHIISNIRKSLDSTENHALFVKDKYEARAYIKKIARFNEKYVNVKDTSFTTHGWFAHPIRKDFRDINSENITKEDYEYLQEQLKKLNNIESLLPKTYENKDYYEILLRQIKPDELDNNISQLDKFIANEILSDLKEVLTKYKSFVNIEAINKSELPKKLKKRFKFPDYIWKFGEYTRLQRNGYDGISHNGLSEDSLFTLFNNKLF